MEGCCRRCEGSRCFLIGYRWYCSSALRFAPLMGHVFDLLHSSVSGPGLVPVPAGSHPLGTERRKPALVWLGLSTQSTCRARKRVRYRPTKEAHTSDALRYDDRAPTFEDDTPPSLGSAVHKVDLAASCLHIMSNHDRFVLEAGLVKHRPHRALRVIQARVAYVLNDAAVRFEKNANDASNLHAH